jgi:hypothetical protein
MKPINWIKESSFHSQQLKDKKKVKELKKNKELQERIKNVKRL